jgi:hypothetical protein
MISAIATSTTPIMSAHSVDDNDVVVVVVDVDVEELVVDWASGVGYVCVWLFELVCCVCDVSKALTYGCANAIVRLLCVLVERYALKLCEFFPRRRGFKTATTG